MFKKLRPNDNFNLQIIKRSEDFEGIQFADILAGNLKKIIKNIDGVQPLNIFEKNILKSFSLSNGRDNAFKNNPQIIMWKTEHQEFIGKIARLVSRL